MVTRLPADKFIEKARKTPLIDVRSPAEYAHGHIPGARNIPIFDDMERADVGTLYHKAGREEAVRKGLEIVGPKMKAYVEDASKMASGGELMVYCWRGGMRSESMAWLFDTAGIKTSVLEKGYKGFRKHIREAFERPQKMIILGGMTGSGKTELLHLIGESGKPVLDLERIAHHKGSVFGNLGLPEQPTNEQFENDLGMEWLDLDPSAPVYIEDESINIGRDSIPKALFEKMQQSPLLYIDMPLESRVDRLYNEYASFPKDTLKQMMQKISRRLGGARTKEAMQAIDEDRLRDAIRISLAYYDKAYKFDVEKRRESLIYRFPVKDDKMEDLLSEIIVAKSEMKF